MSRPEAVSNEITLRQLITTPYITYVEALPDSEGIWVRRASCPELDGCSVTAPKAWDAIVELERYLTEYLVDRVAAGKPVPRPRHRDVVHDLSAEELLERAKRTEWIPRLDEPIAAVDGAGLGC
ncbi:hypothetical protein GCM10012320_17930 [Sinomonas cellulolyticus]|uniref:HicB-like antitoxin of toxin-antitoxin system domain-containing protein n=1 Tax=Sinomonas cellulolyticus TaxID=2801916 RepID=A0ABS1K678_9MICC|nr:MULTISPECIES: hypothetical protein [Sinomonas]ASN53379.1 hypothetical protein CGQ25_15795 [Sinomonas sp. R1AF57]MBL0707174.1 hypothetical protein [Sinomonas cellulolyticus]GHG49869.1 hypothetical protein GCM10012320_17930 [Sinomonas sp. KCTC 49339]